MPCGHRPLSGRGSPFHSLGCENAESREIDLPLYGPWVWVSCTTNCGRVLYPFRSSVPLLQLFGLLANFSFARRMPFVRLLGLKASSAPSASIFGFLSPEENMNRRL